MSLATTLLVQAGATLAMTGLIWFVQLVHYPLFAMAARETFPAFAARHQRRTTIVVAPLMLIEAGAATWLLLIGRQTSVVGWLILGWALLAFIWASTVFVQVPLHARLARCWDGATVDRLVKSNWLRTGAWSLRSLIALALLGWQLRS